MRCPINDPMFMPTSLLYKNCPVGQWPFSQNWQMLQKKVLHGGNNPLSRGLCHVSKVYLITCSQSTC